MCEKRTAVVVDDEPITCMDVAEMLREMGFDVVGEAADGFDAVELCRVHRPDLVLMDARMPVFDGLTASKTILEKHYCNCIVLLTAYQDRDMIEKATKAGVSGYLVKPIDQTRFQPAIEVALAQSKRLRQSEARAAGHGKNRGKQTHLSGTEASVAGERLLTDSSLPASSKIRHG